MDKYVDFDNYLNDTEGTTDEIETIEKKEIKNKDNGNDNNLVKFPISSAKENMMNKQCDYKTLAIMTLASSVDLKDKDKKGVGYRTVTKDKVITFTENTEEFSKTKKLTLERNMRKLSQLEGNLVDAYKNSHGRIEYRINYADKNSRCYVTIEEEILKRLSCSHNSTVIKLYVLLKYMCANGERRLTREYLAKQIGLSTKSKDNLKMISHMTDDLYTLGYINKRIVQISSVTKEVYYYVNSFETWKQIQKENKEKQYDTTESLK